MPRL
ncbi:hypothetical protein AVEN_220155-1, partial [Araneus ventricosus]|jgi:hypothetical protein